MVKNTIESGERWRDVPGYAGRYQASDEGRVRQIDADGSSFLLKPYIHRHRSNRTNKSTLVVRMITPAGKRREFALRNIIAATWNPPPPGMVAYHLNGLHEDNAVCNIAFCTRQELGYKFGVMGRCRTVRKVDKAGNILAYYRSARAAGRANYMSYQAVLDRCNGVTKYPFEPYGTSYEWDK